MKQLCWNEKTSNVGAAASYRDYLGKLKGVV